MISAAQHGQEAVTEYVGAYMAQLKQQWKEEKETSYARARAKAPIKVVKLQRS